LVRGWVARLRPRLAGADVGRSRDSHWFQAPEFCHRHGYQETGTTIYTPRGFSRSLSHKSL
jgi:hypothetical protein